MKDSGDFGLENRGVGGKSMGNGVVKIRALKDCVPSADLGIGLGSVSINVQLTKLPVFGGPAEAISHYTKEGKRGSKSDAVGGRREMRLVPEINPVFAV